MKQKLILLTVLLAALSAFSSEYYVDASRPDDSGAATNWATAKQTIQAAVDVATDGDTVLVTNGVYDIGGAIAPEYLPGWGNMLTNRVCVTNAITVHSVNGADVTVIQGASDHGTNGPTAVRCVYLLSGAAMEGFTLQGGHTHAKDGWYYDKMGGGALIFTNSTLTKCILRGNTAEYSGGGACCLGGGTLNNCTLIGNTTAGEGGGAICWGSGMLSNCSIAENAATVGGGVILLNGGMLRNCRLTGNIATTGGGTFSSGGVLDSCTLTGNTAMYGNGLYLTNTVVNNSIIWGDDIIIAAGSTNVVFRYTCSSSLQFGKGNICADPLFVDSVNSNFQLQAGSPCINAGHNSYVSSESDLEGNPRVVGGVVDMGAYENQTAGTDADNDGMDDLWELNQFGGRHFAAPDTICLNGVNTIREAYIAGLDPNDAAAFFEMDGDCTAEKSVLWWNATSGRVYSVYFSTNLMNGFQPLETNIPWTAGAFTDSVHNAQRQLFYKVDVQLAP